MLTKRILLRAADCLEAGRPTGCFMCNAIMMIMRDDDASAEEHDAAQATFGNFLAAYNIPKDGTWLEWANDEVKRKSRVNFLRHVSQYRT